MKKNWKFKIRSYLNTCLSIFLIIFLTGFSCRQTNSKNNPQSSGESNVEEKALKNNINFISPEENTLFKAGQLIGLQVSISDSVNKPDSIQFLINGKRINAIRTLSETVAWNTNDSKVGQQTIEAIAYVGANAINQGSIKVRLVSGRPVVYYTYRILNTYPHDPAAYTQGLIISGNYFYESTGQYGQSSLRKVLANTGEVVQVYNLPDNVFGEGITAYNDKIVQITWREQVAFIYDKSSFQMLNKAYYPMKEGWGMTFDGNNLIMSDGSAYLYFLDKDYFTEVSRLEVCDDHAPVFKLNELEYIEGEIWANVYTTDTIVRINPKTGAVTGKINMKGLLASKYRTDETDVLNGIAYDPVNKRIFVTGKNWAKLFEISVLQKAR